MSDKKILILYATAGAGHKKAAEAILRAATHQGLSAEVADVTAFMPPLLRRLYSDGYLYLISRMTRLWGLLYFLTDAPFLSIFNVHLRRFFDALSCRRFFAYVRNGDFDTVISTQFLASELVGAAKRKFGLSLRLITVVTDFGVHNFWLNPGTDMYCCASPMTRLMLLKKGVPEERIIVTGIPLDAKFISVASRQELCREFGLPQDAFTVLIATGGIGVGPIEEIVDSLKDDAQVLVVCGSNQRLYDKLKAKNHDRIKPFGFIDYMQKLMRVSDCIVTKAGGLTVTEGLAMGLPMVFFYLIPGQEAINAATLTAAGVGVIGKDPGEIRALVRQIRDDSVLRNVRRHKALELSKPAACDHILSLV